LKEGLILLGWRGGKEKAERKAAGGRKGSNFVPGAAFRIINRGMKPRSRFSPGDLVCEANRKGRGKTAPQRRIGRRVLEKGK